MTTDRLIEADAAIEFSTPDEVVAAVKNGEVDAALADDAFWQGGSALSTGGGVVHPVEDRKCASNAVQKAPDAARSSARA